MVLWYSFFYEGIHFLAVRNKSLLFQYRDFTEEFYGDSIVISADDIRGTRVPFALMCLEGTRLKRAVRHSEDKHYALCQADPFNFDMNHVLVKNLAQQWPLFVKSF